MPSLPVPWGMRDYPQVPAFAWLIACPLCFGGVDLWARAIGWLMIGVSLVMMAWLDPNWFRTFRGIAWIAGLFLLWTLFAIVPLPAGWVEALVPARIAGQAHTVLAGRPLATLAYMPGKTLEAFLTLASNLIACALFAHWCRHHDGRRRLIWVILLSGAGVIIVAWLNQFTPGHIYTRKIATTGFMGPFTGRNIFADYLMICSLVGIGFLFQRWWPLRGTIHRSYLTWIAVGIVLSAVGWMMASASRGACLSWVAGLLLFGLFLWRMDEKGDRSVGVFIGVFLVSALTVIYAQTLIKRIDTGLMRAAAGRAATWTQSVKMGADHPWTGVGLGNYPWVFPRYQPPYQAELYTHPENEYLEWWDETGWIGILLILLVLFRIGRKLAVMHKWKDIEWQAGGLAALGALLIHSFVDFPLHIPANTFLAAAILGLVWGNLMRHPIEAAGTVGGRLSRLVTVLGGSALICLAVLAFKAERQAEKGDFANASLFWPVEPRYRYPQIRKLLSQLEYLPAHRLAAGSQEINPVDWKLYYLDGWSRAPLFRGMEDARAAFEKAIYWSPAKSETARKAGLFFWPRRPEIAVDFWKRSLEYEPEHDRAFVIFLQRTDNIPGQVEFASVLADGDTGRLMILADTMYSWRMHEKLGEIVEAILAAPPSDTDSREKLVSLLLKLERVQSAQKLLSQTPHKTVRMKFYQAEIYRQKKRWKEALELYHAITSALPEGGKIPRLAELNLETLRRKSEAEPDDLDVQASFGWKLMKAGRWAEADQLWARMIPRWPAYHDATRFRAIGLEEQGRLSEAVGCWKDYFSSTLPRP